MAQAPRPATAPQLSARRPGVLTSQYEGRFGTPDVLHPSMTEVNGGPPPTSRGLAPGLKTFTDAQNPFNRNLSKAVVSTDAHRADVGRAGMRSRNPGIIPASSDRTSNTDSAQPRLVPHRYSTDQDYKPGKAFGGRYAAKDSPIAHPEILTSKTSLSSGRALQNYLNDMKSSTSSRKVHTDWGPSQMLQKMNDMKVKLGAEMRDESRDRHPPERRTEPGAVPLTPRGCEDSPLFARKKRTLATPTLCSPRTVPGEATELAPTLDDASSAQGEVGHAAGVCCGEGRTSRARAASMMARRNLRPDGFLAHEEASTDSRQRAQSLQSQRRRQADERMEAINQHMRDTLTWQKDNFETFKARGMHGSGVLPLAKLVAEDTTSLSGNGRISRSTSLDSRNLAP